MISIPDPFWERRKDAHAALELLRDFMSPVQRRVIQRGLASEEAGFFVERLVRLGNIVAKMPATYESGEGVKIAHLHYFVGGCDWYIIEKDKGSPSDAAEGVPPQSQAYGYANLGNPDCAEFGYISLPEIFSIGAELDLHWEPKPFSEIK